MRVMFAPDWRSGVPYQRPLAEALATHGVTVEFPAGYRRGLPLARMMRGSSAEWLHLHWPEAYYPVRNDRFDWLRCARFGLDLALSTRGRHFALTAHNLHAHNRGEHPAVLRNSRLAVRRANVVFAHSAAARNALIETFGATAGRIHVIPSGDLSVALDPPCGREDARTALGLGHGPLCLMFGMVEPYKGIEEVLAYWRSAKPPAELVIAGQPMDAAYQKKIEECAAELANVHLRLQWLDDQTLRLWLSAADLALFNYRSIFNSGAASLARSFGVPVLLPHRLKTIELGEPDPRVARFDGFHADFSTQLARLLAAGSNYDAAAGWRASIAWPRIAELTAAAYRSAL